MPRWMVGQFRIHLTPEAQPPTSAVASSSHSILWLRFQVSIVPGAAIAPLRVCTQTP